MERLKMESDYKLKQTNLKSSIETPASKKISRRSRRLFKIARSTFLKIKKNPTRPKFKKAKAKQWKGWV